MKRMLLLAALALFVSQPTQASEDSYGDNYQKGYKEGYTYNGGGMRDMAPMPPMPPMPNFGETNSDGYRRGLLDGREAKESCDF